jgi:hypothetical protein
MTRFAARQTGGRLLFWHSFLRFIGYGLCIFAALSISIMSFLQKVVFMGLLPTFWSVVVEAQCSICTKTAQQLGKESAEGLNSGILYLMLLPFAIGGFIAYRWWQNEKATVSNSQG